MIVTLSSATNGSCVHPCGHMAGSPYPQHVSSGPFLQIAKYQSGFDPSLTAGTPGHQQLQKWPAGRVLLKGLQTLWWTMYHKSKIWHYDEIYFCEQKEMYAAYMPAQI